MFNPSETILLEFNGCLNPNNFDIIENKSLEPYLAELKQFGKPAEELQINDDLLRALGIRILKNTFTVKKDQVNIYIFITQRFPAELPQVYLSDEISKKWKYKFYFQAPEEVKKDGKYNLTMIIAKVQNEISRNGIKIQFSEDYKNLKDTFSSDTLISNLSKMDVKSLTSSQNPSQHEISQQFRMTKQYLEIIEYFNQVSMLNERVINDIRGKQSQTEDQQAKLFEKSEQLESNKRQFAEVFCAVEGIKSRFSKFSIVQWLEDKIKELTHKVQLIEKKPFSNQTFLEYKGLMKQLKKLELRKEKIV